MDLIVATVVVVVLGAGASAYRAYRTRRGRRADPLANDVVAGLVVTARARLLAQIGSFERTAVATAADDGRWIDDGGDLTLADRRIGHGDLAELTLAYAAAQARRGAAAGIDEAAVMGWLRVGATKAIAILTQGRLEQMGRRLERLGAQPPPSAAELAELHREHAADRAELEHLLGGRADTSALPTATVRRR